MAEKNLQQRNEKLMLDIIRYLQKHDLFYDVLIYVNGHRYASEKPDSMVMLDSGTGPYYDQGAYDVTKYIEYASPDILTISFEGPLYDALNYPETKAQYAVEDDLQNICAKYGLYFEQGYAWSLAVYE